MIKISFSENIIKQEIANFLSSDLFITEFNRCILHTEKSSDKYASCLLNILKTNFSSYTWVLNSSQSPFDIYSVDANIAIELKSYFINSSTRPKFILSNASIYPEKVKVEDVVTGNKLKSIKTTDAFLDVLVVVVEKDRVVGFLKNVAVVDGSFWGVTYASYKACSDFFKLLNDNRKEILSLLLEKDPDNLFVRNALVNTDVNLNLRKLISIKNPLSTGEV